VLDGEVVASDADGDHIVIVSDQYAYHREMRIIASVALLLSRQPSR
jgi:hypothetical protein